MPRLSTIEVAQPLLGAGNDHASTITAAPSSRRAQPRTTASPSPTATTNPTVTAATSARITVRVHGRRGNRRASSTSTACGSAATRSWSPAAAGPTSPLVVYGDTSQDGIWYSGRPTRAGCRRLRAEAVRPVPGHRRRGRALPVPARKPVRPRRQRRHRRPGAVRRRRAGCAARPSASSPTAARATTRSTAARRATTSPGGSGDDLILGQRGSDQIYGDSGVNVDVITRSCSIPTANTSVARRTPTGSSPARTCCTARAPDPSTGRARRRSTTSSSATTASSPRTCAAGRADLTGPPGLRPPADHAARHRASRPREPADGADDVIHGDAGNDRILGGNGDDVIAGDDGADIVFGDHGRIHYADARRAPQRSTYHDRPDRSPAGDDTINGERRRRRDPRRHRRRRDLRGRRRRRDLRRPRARRVRHRPSGMIRRILTTDPANLAGDDTITGDADADIILGRQRRRPDPRATTAPTSSSATTAASRSTRPSGIVREITTTDPLVPAGDDVISGDADRDIILGGNGQRRASPAAPRPTSSSATTVACATSPARPSRRRRRSPTARGTSSRPRTRTRATPT